jgi:hypothetical protein
MWHAWERREMCTGFWCERQKERDHSEDQGVDARMGSEWILGGLAVGVWSGFSWLRIGTVGGLFWIRWWTFGFWLHRVSQSVSTSEVLQHIMTCEDVSAWWPGKVSRGNSYGLFKGTILLHWSQSVSYVYAAEDSEWYRLSWPRP